MTTKSTTAAKKKAAKQGPPKRRAPAYRDIYAALLAAQEDFPEITTDAVGETLDAAKDSYPYLTYPALVAHVGPPLRKHGILYYHEVGSLYTGCTESDKHLIEYSTVRTFLRFVGTITATGGERKDAQREISSEGWVYDRREKLPQDLGEWITYGKRYTLSGLLGFAAEPDNDAAETSAARQERPPQKDTRPSNAPKKAPLLTAKQLKAVGFMMDNLELEEAGRQQLVRDASHGRASNLGDLSKGEASSLLGALEEIRKERALDQTPELYQGEEDQTQT